MAGFFDDVTPAADNSGGTPQQTDDGNGGYNPLRITISKGQPAAARTSEQDQQPDQAGGLPALSERDRKLIIRTVLGEASGEGDEGQKAVAAVILNRLRSGQFGGSIPQVIAQKNAFEPWMTPQGRQRMLSYAETGPEFSRAAANLDAILSGGEVDPTDGATHFYAPKAQAALGRQPPKWAQGQPLVIGNHYFYNPAAPKQPQPVQVASNDGTFAPQMAETGGQGGGLFEDVPPAPAAGSAKPAAPPPTATFAERFSGEGLGGVPSANAPELATGLRKSADENLIERGYGYKPSQAEMSLDTVVEQLANTFLLNVPRNIGAAYIASKYDVPFNQAYESLKNFEEARARRAPESAIIGTGAGVGAGMATLPAAKFGKGAASLLGRAGEAAATGAGYGLTSELLDSKDPVKASIAAALGGVLGAVASPVAEKIVGLVTKMVASGKSAATFLKPDGTLSDEAVAAAKEAGVDVSTLQKVMQAKYAQTFAKKGATPATAREAAANEFGIKLSPGEATNDYGLIAREQSMARDTEGPLAGQKARAFYDEQSRSVGQAKTGIQERVAGSEPLVDNVNDAANQVGQAVRGKATSAKNQFKGAYKDALEREGEFPDIAFRDIGERIRRDSLKAPEPVVIDDVTTPVAARAIQHLDNTIGKVKIQDRAEPRSMEPVTAGTHQFAGEPPRISGTTPGPDTIAGVNLKGVDQARKQLVAFYKAAKSSGNASDIRAMQRIIGGFDDELETAMAVGLFKGDDQALPALKEARKLFSNYQKTFRSQFPGDSVGKAMEKIVERDATGGEIANMLYGKAAIGEKGDAVRLAGRLKGLLDPEDWAAVRQGLWLRLSSQPEGVTDFGPQALSTRISKFLSGDGADMAKVIFSPKELGELRRFATVLKSIVPPTGTVNYSGTGYEVARQMLMGTGIGAGAFWLTEDPVVSASLAAGKIGARLGRIMLKGRAAAKHFASGAPKAPSATAISVGRGAGVGAGLAAGQAQ